MTSVETKKINVMESIDRLEFQKMLFIYNAINSGWEVKNVNDSYIFKKKHEGKKEIYLDSYLKRFIEKNMNMSDIK
jgi:hypothetical protein